MTLAHVKFFLFLVMLTTGCGGSLGPLPTQIPTLSYSQRIAAELVVNGEIQEITLPSTMTIWGFVSSDGPSTSPHEVPIRVKDGTKFSRCPVGIVDNLADFMMGDKVVIEGQWEGETFVAKSIQPLFYSIEGIVTEYEGNQMETTAGTLVLAEDVRGFDQDGEQISGDGLTTGVAFFGDYFDDPESAQRILVGFRLK
jgi:hypothetical protein